MGISSDLRKLHKRKEEETKSKYDNIGDQVIENFFNIFTPDEIKRTIKESIYKGSLPDFTCKYILRSFSGQADNNKYIETVNHCGQKCIIVDLDFHNIGWYNIGSENRIDAEEFRVYRKFKKQLGSDFYFSKEGSTEEGHIKIIFCEIHRYLF